MGKEKDMMNPMNWGVDEIREATIAILVAMPFLVIFYIAMWIFY